MPPFGEAPLVALTDAFATIFAVLEATILIYRTRAEADLPGSGAKIFDPLLADLAVIKAQTDVSRIAGAFLAEVGKALSSGRAVVMPALTDLAG